MNFNSQFLTAAKLPQHHSSDFRGLDIVVEWPKGSVRVGEDKNGKKWHRKMEADYGYIPNTAGAGDKEGLDVYIGPDKESDRAYVVEQLKDNGKFDEYKVLLGFPDLDTAYETYLKHYPNGWDDNVGEVYEVPFEDVVSGVEEHQENNKTASSVEEKQYKDFIQHYGDFIREVTGEKPPSFTKFVEYLHDFKRHITSTTPIYRRIKVPANWNVQDALTLGVSWTHDRSVAENWVPDSAGYDTRFTVPTKDYKYVLLEGRVNPNDIDWLSVVADGFCTSESLVKILENSPIHLVKVDNVPINETKTASTAPGTYPSRAVPKPRPPNIERYVWMSCPSAREDHIMRGLAQDHSRFCDQRYYDPPITTKEYDNATRGYAEVKNDGKSVILSISPMCRPEFQYYPPSIIEKFNEMYPGYKIYTDVGKTAGFSYLKALQCMTS